LSHIAESFSIIATYGALLQKAKGDISSLPIIATAITGPAGETVYRIDDIIGEVSSCFLLFLVSSLRTCHICGTLSFFALNQNALTQCILLNSLKYKFPLHFSLRSLTWVWRT